MTETPTDPRSVSLERELPHPADKVWRALTQPHLVGEWLMKGDIAATPGHRFTLTGEWGGTLDCEILESDPPRHLAYRWDFAHADPAYDLRSVVTFTLTPTERGTRLRVEQVGFRPDQRQASGGARVGWPRNLDALARLLDAQP